MNGENHHIIPRSIAPDLVKDTSNIVRLTYREHYIAHWLLTKIYTEGKEHKSMVYAFYLFHSWNKNKGYFNSKAYETNREEWMKFLIGKSPSLETRRKISAGNKGKELTEEQKIKIGIKSKAYWNDENNRKLSKEKHKKFIEDHPEYAKQQSKLLKKIYENPSLREVVSKNTKARWDDPEWRDKFIKKHQENGNFERFATYADNCKGKIWWCKDGEKDRRSFESPGPGWQPGRTYHRK